MTVFNVRNRSLPAPDAIEEVADVRPVLHRTVGLFGENPGGVVGPGAPAVGGRRGRRLIRLFVTRGLRGEPEPAAIHKQCPPGPAKLDSITPEMGSAGVAVQPKGVVIQD